MVDRKASVHNISDLSRFITPRVDLYVHRNAGNANGLLTGFLENLYIKAIKKYVYLQRELIVNRKHHVEAQIIITNQSMHTPVRHRVAIFLIFSK